MKKGSAAEVYQFNSLLDADQEVIDANSTVVGLTELDSPVFKHITPETFDSLRRIFSSEKTILWITSGRRDDEPYSNMTVGFGRVAANESTELLLQHLDIAEPWKTAPETVADILLRLHASKFTTNERLQAVEPEIIIDHEQREFVSRLRPIPELNDRYNSANRAIIKDIDIKQSPVSMSLTSTGCTIRELSKYEVSTAADDTIELHITHAVLSALTSPFGYKFLVLGLQPETGHQYLVLVASLASVIKLPSKSAVRCLAPAGLTADILTITAASLISMAILEPLYSGQTLLVHNATKTVAQSLDIQAAMRNIRIIHTTDGAADETLDSWIRLPRYITHRELEDILLDRPSSFVGFSSNDTEASENEATLISSLPAHCRVITAKTIYSAVGSESKYCTSELLGDRLSKAVKFAMEEVGKKGHSSLITESFSIESLANGVRSNDPMSIINFIGTATLPVRVTRLDAKSYVQRQG